MTIKDVCRKARLLHKVGGGLIDRNTFIANCRSSADEDLRRVQSSDEIFKDIGLSDLTSRAKIVQPHPHLTSEIKNQGKKFTISKLFVKTKDARPSIFSANSFIWNPASLGGAYQIHCEYTTLCWMRFLAVKELMHLYNDMFDDDTDWGKRLPPLLMCVRSIHNVMPGINFDLDNEASAFYLAIEYLLPWSERKTISNIFNFILQASGRSSDLLSAKCFFVPEYVITHILMKDPVMKGFSYLNLSRVINEELDEEETALA